VPVVEVDVPNSEADAIIAEAMQMEEDPEMAAAIAASMGQEIPIVDDESNSKHSDSGSVKSGKSAKSVVSEKDIIDTTMEAKAAEEKKAQEAEKKLLFTLKAERVWVCGETEADDEQDDVVLVLFRKERIPIKPEAPVKEDNGSGSEEEKDDNESDGDKSDEEQLPLEEPEWEYEFRTIGKSSKFGLLGQGQKVKDSKKFRRVQFDIKITSV